MAIIKEVHAREVLSAQGIPTLEVDLLVNNFVARAAVPSTRFQWHQVILRDQGKRHNGMGVLKAAAHIQDYLSIHLKEKDCTKQLEIDHMLMHMDGTKDKRDLGANTLLAVSMAVCRAGAYAGGISLFQHIADIYGTKKIKVPQLMIPMLATRTIARELMIVPRERSLMRQLESAAAVNKELQRIVRTRYRDETRRTMKGLHTAPVLHPDEAIEMIAHAAEQAGRKVDIAVRCKLHYRNSYYSIGSRKLTADQMVDYYKSLARSYPLVHIEDPFISSHVQQMRELAKKVRVSLGRLARSQAHHVRLFARENAANALTVRLHHHSTLTDVMEAARAAHNRKWSVCAATSPLETSDDFLGDFAVGIGAQHVKVRLMHDASKLNQLIRIEEMQ